MSHTKNTGDNFITPALFVAYNATTETHDDGTVNRVPTYITVPPEDWPGSIDDAESRDELFESLRLEGAIAAKLVEGDADGSPSVDERLFTPDESLPPVFVVTDPSFDANPPYTATLAELRTMFPDTDFVESNSGPVIVEPQKGPRYIGILARQWRDRRAGKIEREEVPIIHEGDIPPNDRTYVFVSAPSERFRNSPDLTPNVRKMERSPDVVPYAHGRALWSYVEVDWFCLLGTERAIDAARQAVALVVGARAYDGFHHYRQFVSGRPYHPRQRGSGLRGEVLAVGDDTEPVTMPGTGDGRRTRGFTGFVGIPDSDGDRRTISVCESRNSGTVIRYVNVADLSELLQSLADMGELWGIYQTENGGVVAEDREGNIYPLEPKTVDGRPSAVTQIAVVLRKLNATSDTTVYDYVSDRFGKEPARHTLPEFFAMLAEQFPDVVKPELWQQGTFANYGPVTYCSDSSVGNWETILKPSETVARPSESTARVYDQLAAEAEHGESGFGEAATQVARVARNTADRLRLLAAVREAVNRPGHYGSGPVLIRYDETDGRPSEYDVIPSTYHESDIWRHDNPTYAVLIDWRDEPVLVDGVPRLLDKEGNDLASYSDDELLEYVTE